jgi:nucleoside-diphosphate-sugar epimerase
VLVLGATGFIGGTVARALSRCGAEVHLLARDRTAAARVRTGGLPAAGVYEGDAGDAETLERVLRELRPAVTFNLAGYGVDPAERDEHRARRVNEALVLSLAGAVDRHLDPAWVGAALVHAGSALEYGTAAGDLNEETVESPTTLYGRTKLAGSRGLREHCEATGLPALTARLFMVYGPGERPGRLLPSLLRAARSREPLPLTAGLQERDFTFVEDVAVGLLRLGAAPGVPPGEIVNLATGRLTSVRGFVETAAAVLGIAGERLLFGALPTRSEEMQHAPVRVERLRARTGWVPVTSVEEGIRETVRRAEDG